MIYEIHDERGLKTEETTMSGALSMSINQRDPYRYPYKYLVDEAYHSLTQTSL